MRVELERRLRGRERVRQLAPVEVDVPCARLEHVPVALRAAARRPRSPDRTGGRPTAPASPAPRGCRSSSARRGSRSKSRASSSRRPTASCVRARATADRLLATRLTARNANSATQFCGSAMREVADRREEEEIEAQHRRDRRHDRHPEPRRRRHHEHDHQVAGRHRCRVRDREPSQSGGDNRDGGQGRADAPPVAAHAGAHESPLMSRRGSGLGARSSGIQRAASCCLESTDSEPRVPNPRQISTCTPSSTTRSGRQPEERRRPHGVARHQHEQPLAPHRHARRLRSR